MALDKLVDSAQLDSDLTSVANAIRTKGGTSASLAFPQGFVDAVGAIQAGGGLDYVVQTVTRTSNTQTVNVDREFNNFLFVAFVKTAPSTYPPHNYVVANLFAYVDGDFWTIDKTWTVLSKNGTEFRSATANPSILSVSETNIAWNVYTTSYAVTGDWVLVQIEIPDSFGMYSFRNIAADIAGGA